MAAVDNETKVGDIFLSKGLLRKRCMEKIRENLGTEKRKMGRYETKV